MSAAMHAALFGEISNFFGKLKAVHDKEIVFDVNNSSKPVEVGPISANYGAKIQGVSLSLDLWLFYDSARFSDVKLRATDINGQTVKRYKHTTPRQHNFLLLFKQLKLLPLCVRW